MHRLEPKKVHLVSERCLVSCWPQRHAKGCFGGTLTLYGLFSNGRYLVQNHEGHFIAADTDQVEHDMRT